uniref:Secreted protein n=1 Tax=Parascaris univalens TaxID=6257 RepID=A0A915A9Q2_PARUN
MAGIRWGMDDVVQRWWLFNLTLVRMMDVHCCVGSATIEKFRFMALSFRYHSHRLPVDRCTNSYPIQTKTSCMSVASSHRSILQQLFQILFNLSCLFLVSFISRYRTSA